MSVTPSSSSFYSYLEDGVALMWNNDFDAAEEFFKKHKDDNVRFSLCFAEVITFRSIISDLNADQKVALERLNHTVKLAESHLQSYEQGQFPANIWPKPEQSTLKSWQLETKIVLADALVMLAALLVMDDARLKGLINLRKSWKIYKTAIESAEKTKEAFDTDVLNSLKFGAGLFFFVISLIPPGLPQKVAALAGFKGGDKQTGLKYLRECFASKSVRCELAGAVLIINNVMLTPTLGSGPRENINEAEKITQQILKKFPNSSLFEACYSLIHLQRQDTKLALESVNRSIGNCSHVAAFPAVFFRLKANVYSSDLDWKNLYSLLERTGEEIQQLEKTNGKSRPWTAPWNQFRLAAAGSMMNLPALLEKKKELPYETKPLFEKVASMKNHKDRFVQTIAKQCIRFAKFGGYYSMFELLFVNGVLEGILVFGGEEKRNKISKTIDEIASIAKGSDVNLSTLKPTKTFLGISFGDSSFQREETIENRASYLLYKGMTLRASGKLKEATQLIEEILSNASLFTTEAMYVAGASVIMGKICNDSGKPEESSKYWESVIKMPEFAWSNNLKSQARGLLNQIGVEDTSTIQTEVEDKEAEKMLQDEEIKTLIEIEQEEINENTN